MPSSLLTGNAHLSSPLTFWKVAEPGAQGKDSLSLSLGATWMKWGLLANDMDMLGIMSTWGWMLSWTILLHLDRKSAVLAACWSHLERNKRQVPSVPQAL